MNLKITKTHILLMAIAIISHLIALAITWYYVIFAGLAKECNGVAQSTMTSGNFIFFAAASTILLVVAYLLIITFNPFGEQNPALFVLCIGTIICELDALNDIWAITKNPLVILTNIVLTSMLNLLGIPVTC